MVGVTPSTVNPVTLVCVLPSVSVVAPSVVVEFASAELGIEDAETLRVGVVVEVATEGTNHVGHEPLLATKLVTDPPPAPDPVNVHVVPLHDPAPELKENVNAPAVVLIEVTPLVLQVGQDTA